MLLDCGGILEQLAYQFYQTLVIDLFQPTLLELAREGPTGSLDPRLPETNRP